jgi:hypothetical protein
MVQKPFPRAKLEHSSKIKKIEFLENTILGHEPSFQNITLCEYQLIEGGG